VIGAHHDAGLQLVPRRAHTHVDRPLAGRGASICEQGKCHHATPSLYCALECMYLEVPQRHTQRLHFRPFSVANANGCVAPHEGLIVRKYHVHCRQCPAPVTRASKARDQGTRHNLNRFTLHLIGRGRVGD
jgi:hypothetical protein